MSLFLNEDDLNDFISPGQACIKPVPTPKQVFKVRGIHLSFECPILTHRRKPVVHDQDVIYKVSLDMDIEVPQPATISLNDCLACRFVAI